MAIEAVAAVAAKEVAAQAAKEAVTQAAREIAQKMATEAGAQGAGNELQTAMMERQTMQEGFRLGEMPESKGEGREFLKQKETEAADELRGNLDTEEIRPETENITKAESSENQNPAKVESQQSEGAHEITMSPVNAEALNGREVHWPQTGGHWEELPDGKWKWVPDSDYTPLKQNEDGKTWKDILNREGIDGITFSKDGEPDFSEVSRGTVEIEDFTDNRPDNFAQADVKLAEKWNKELKDGKNDWTPQDVRAYRDENKLVWHERSDMKTMDLVPKDVHNNIPHSGGISVVRHQPESSTPKQALLS